MKNYGGLLDIIAKDCNITKGFKEVDEIWKQRIIYSAIGRLALASVYDLQDDDASEPQSVSIKHMKNRIKDVCEIYSYLYPEILSEWNADNLSDELYELYTNAGYFYHVNYRVVPAMDVCATCFYIKYMRGSCFATGIKMSGLGMYMDSSEAGDVDEIKGMFGLEETTLDVLWKKIISGRAWRIGRENDVEYMRVQPSFTKGYWEKSIPIKDGISILRTCNDGQKMYYLYKWEEGNVYVSQLPDWMVVQKRYRVLMNACLKQYSTLPTINYVDYGDVVYVNFQYLLPYRELHFCKLFSWPQSFKDNKIKDNFNRIFSKNVFESLKSILMKQGYSFQRI